MKKIKKLFLVVILIISFGFVTSPQNVQAATNYCTTSGTAQNSASKTRVQYGNYDYGACHIQYYHLNTVGGGSILIGGQKKSQFSRNITATEMADIAAGVISIGTKSYDGEKVISEAYDISLNQTVRVVYYHHNDGYKYVLTMYPLLSQ